MRLNHVFWEMLLDSYLDLFLAYHSDRTCR